MSAVPPVSSNSNSGSSGSTSNSSITGLSQSDFYKIITTELENQDPDDATSTSDMVQQMMELSDYQATQNNSVEVADLTNYSTATSLLGKTVDISVPATSVTAAQTVSGQVTEATFGTSLATVTVNGTSYPLSEVINAYSAVSNTGTGSSDSSGSGGNSSSGN